MMEIIKLLTPEERLNAFVDWSLAKIRIITKWTLFLKFPKFKFIKKEINGKVDIFSDNLVVNL